MKLRALLIPVAILLVAGVLLAAISTQWNANRSSARVQTTNDAYIHADIVPLSTRVTDTLKTLNVGDYQHVHAGDLLAQLDDTDYRADLDKANADVESANAALAENAAAKQVQASKLSVDESSIAQAQAALHAANDEEAQAQAAAAQTLLERKRQQNLFDQQAATQQTLEKTVAQDSVAQGKLQEAEAGISKAQEALASSNHSLEMDQRTLHELDVKDRSLRAKVVAANATVRSAEVQLGYTRIVAPVDGEVGERKVFPGQLVSPGVEVLQLVEGEVWVQANYEETQLGNVRPGDAAEVTIDSLPGVTFKGKVTEIAPSSGATASLLPPDNATGNFTKVVQRIPVKIILDANQPQLDRLRPGFSAIVKVHTR